MRAWRNVSRVLLIGMVLLGIAETTHVVWLAHGAGMLSIVPPSTPLANPGATVTVDVRVDNMDSLNGWDIAVKTNETALNGTSIDFSTDTVFPQGTQPFEGTKCINNVPQIASTSCNGYDGPGVVHYAVVFFGSNLPQAPVSGVLFSIHYRAGNYTFSNISIVYSQITGPPCNPICSVIQLDSSNDGVYGTLTSPAVTFSAQDKSLSVIQGFNVNTTATITSLNNFVGSIKLGYLLDSTGNGIQVKFNTTSVTLNENSTANVKITIITALSTSTSGHLLNITATGPRVFGDVLINLSVQPPGDFNVAFSPGLLQVPQNSSTFATVLVSSQKRQFLSQEFSGNVSLTVVAKNATASLVQTLLYVGPGQTAETTISIWVPPSFYGFTYLINVTGVWVKDHDLNFTGQLVVTHLPPSVFPNITPDTLTVIAGHSILATLNVMSANYFQGYVYPYSTLSGGTARYYGSILKNPRLDIGQTLSFPVNITMDRYTTPGHYVILFTAIGQLASGAAVAQSVAADIVVLSNGLRVAPALTIAGLSVPVYFGVLGGFAVIFLFLTALRIRKRILDKDEWD